MRNVKLYFDVSGKFPKQLMGVTTTIESNRQEKTEIKSKDIINNKKPKVQIKVRAMGLGKN